MSLSDKQFEFIKDVSKLIIFCVDRNFKLTGGELLRTKAQQELYFAADKTRTLKSNHLKKLAIDLNFFRNGHLTYAKSRLQFIGDYWESLDPKNRWGGNYTSFKDTSHFERNV